MEIEDSIILALSESMIYSKLRQESRLIRRQYEKSLSNEAFNEALKRLVADKLVNRKKINRREIEYSLNLKLSNHVKKAITSIDTIQERIKWIEMFTKFIERKANEIDEGRNGLIKMGFENFKTDPIHLFVVREYQTLAMNLIQHALAYMKTSFFMTSGIWNIGFTKKHQVTHQKKFSELVDRLINVINKLNKESAESFHMIIKKELVIDIQRNKVDIKRFEKLKTNPEKFFYESLS